MLLFILTPRRRLAINKKVVNVKNFAQQKLQLERKALFECDESTNSNWVANYLLI